MSTPYRSRPPHAFWSSEVAGKAPMVEPHVPYAPMIGPQTRIGTAGSCFAQHIARRLADSGYSFHVEERAPHFMAAEVAQLFGYGLFSARYGNIYTTRQLLQLVKQAEHGWDPGEPAWSRGERFVDPFRPTVTPAGYFRAADVAADREPHLRAVSRLLRGIDIFVFTLGLTEMWEVKATGAALPVCPGTSAGGTFDRDRYGFRNLTYPEVHDDLAAFIELARAANPALRFIFTVSPVPLIATMESHSVLTATTHSKAILRAAVGEIERSIEGVHYFPSFEIITGSFNRGAYYGPDLREVTGEGVDHVMSVFFKSLCLPVGKDAKRTAARAAAKGSAGAAAKAQVKAQVRAPGKAAAAGKRGAAGRRDFVDLVCDETLLEEI